MSESLGYTTASPTFEGKPVNPKILAIEQKIMELHRLSQEAYEECMIEYSFMNHVLNLNSELFKQYKDKRQWGLVD